MQLQKENEENLQEMLTEDFVDGTITWFKIDFDIKPHKDILQ